MSRRKKCLLSDLKFAACGIFDATKTKSSQLYQLNEFPVLPSFFALINFEMFN